MTAQQIEMDYNYATGRAAELDILANELENLAEVSLGDSMSSLAAAWQSESADIFTEKGILLESGLAESARQLANIAESIRICARQTMEAEQEALELAQTREYGGGI